MDENLKSLLLHLMSKEYFGEKHTPEDRAIRHSTDMHSKQQKKDFEREYSYLISMKYIIRLKKRTGKGSDWHISINPDMAHYVKEMVK